MRKISVRRAAREFEAELTQIRSFLQLFNQSGIPPGAKSFVYDFAVIRLHSAFEHLMTEAIVGAVNNDTRTISQRTGIAFPSHLRGEVCDYLVTSGGFLDFKGRDGLIGVLKQFVPDTHYLVTIAKDPAHSATLNQLPALRNFAAHGSDRAKRAARKAVGVNLSSAGSWLRRQGRFETLARGAEGIASAIRTNAPY